MLEQCCRTSDSNQTEITSGELNRADVAPHRGFNLKAREVLLEPLPPFAVTAKVPLFLNNHLFI